MTSDLKDLIARLRSGDTMSMRPAADALEALMAKLDKARKHTNSEYHARKAAEAEVERLRAELNRPVKIDEVRLSVGEWILLPEDILRGVNAELLRLARAALHPAQETADD